MYSRKRKYLFKLLFLSQCFAFSSFAKDVNVEEKPRQLDVLKAAEPIKRVNPKYPYIMAKSGKEGWVRVSFVINEEGKVIDPIVHDSSGSEYFERAALRAVKEWQYSPATVNGKPVEQCDSKVQLDFRIEGDNKSVSRKFYKNYVKLKDAVLENRLEDAKELYEQFVEKPHWNFAEVIHFSVVAAIYFDAIGEEHKLQNELTNIVNNGWRYLKQDTYLHYLYMKYSYQIKNNKFAAAKDTAEKALEHHPDHEITALIRNANSRVADFIDSNEAILVKGKIHSDKSWSHKLLRSRFEVNAENAKFDRIEVRCDNKRSSFGNVSAQQVFIPEQWGQCYVYVDAPVDTEFSLIELTSI